LTGERLSVAEASFRGIDGLGIPAAELANTDMTAVVTGRVKTPEPHVRHDGLQSVPPQAMCSR